MNGSLAAVDGPPKALNPGPQDGDPGPQDEDDWVDPDDVPHLESDSTEGMTADEAEAEAHRLTRVYPRLIGYNGNMSIIAFGVGNQLRDLWIEAWDHYADHGCESGAECLDRLLEQLIGAFHTARGQTGGDD